MPRLAIAGLLPLLALAGCFSVERDEADRQARFFDARVRMELEGEPDHDGGHVEVAWRQVDGDTNGLDYRFGVGEIGLGFESQVGADGWVGFVTGVSWLHTELDPDTEDFASEDAYGPYVAIQGGWMATSWLEAFARCDVAGYVADLSTAFGFEAGARFHVVEHATVFVGWRYVRYDMVGLEPFLTFDKFELDASGLVLGLELAF